MIPSCNYYKTNPVLEAGQEINEYHHETGGYPNSHGYYNNYYYNYPQYFSNQHDQQYYPQYYNDYPYKTPPPPQWHQTFEERSPSTDESLVSLNSQSISSSYNQPSPGSNQSSSLITPQEHDIEHEHSIQYQNLDECVDPLEGRSRTFDNQDKEISQSVVYYYNNNSVHCDDNYDMMNGTSFEFNNEETEKENEVIPPNVNLFSSSKDPEMYHKPLQQLNPPCQNIQAPKLYKSSKNKKLNLKMKTERKVRSSPNDPIPYVNKNIRNHFICTFDGCGFRAKRRSNIIRHMEAMHVPHVFLCCSQLYPTKSHFEGHRRLIHSDGIFRCVVKDCARSFNRKSLLHRHEDMCHSSILDSEIACSVCHANLPHPGQDEEVVKCHAFLHSSSYFPSV